MCRCVQCSSSGEAIKGKATDRFLDGTLGRWDAGEDWTRRSGQGPWRRGLTLTGSKDSTQMSIWAWAGVWQSGSGSGRENVSVEPVNDGVFRRRRGRSAQCDV